MIKTAGLTEVKIRKINSSYYERPLDNFFFFSNSKRNITSSSSHTVSTDFPDTLSTRPQHPSLPAGPPNYILCPHKALINQFLLLSQRWCVHVLGGQRISFLISFLLLQQYLTCLVRHIWMVFEIELFDHYLCVNK